MLPPPERLLSIQPNKANMNTSSHSEGPKGVRAPSEAKEPAHSDVAPSFTDSAPLNVGIDFIDAQGERVTSIQLLRDGKSVANVGYQGDRIRRFAFVHDVCKGTFLARAAALRASIQPVSFA